MSRRRIEDAFVDFVIKKRRINKKVLMSNNNIKNKK